MSRSCVRRVQCARHIQVEANYTVRALNSMFGANVSGKGDFPLEEALQGHGSAQAKAIEFIIQSVHELGRPPADLTGPGAWSMLRTTEDYAESQPVGSLVSYKPESVSLPDEGWSPIELGQLWGGDGCDFVYDLVHNQLLPPDQVEARLRQAGVSRAYSDPLLRVKHNYIDFIKRLWRSNLIDVDTSPGVEQVECFFVSKKMGRQRMDLGLLEVNGRPVRPGTLLTPRLRDRHPVSSTSCCHLQYVDNLVVLGTDREMVKGAFERAVKELTRAGLQVHEVESSSDGAQVLGWHFTANGEFRPTRRDLKAAWSTKLLATDASEWGLGATQSDIPYEQAKSIGKFCERLSTSNGRQLAATAGSGSSLCQLPRKEMRVTARKKHKAASSEMTVLQESSVSKKCFQRYQFWWEQISQLVTNRSGGLKPAKVVDKVLATYLEEMYHNGEDVSSAQYVVAALCFFRPSLRTPGMVSLPKIKQSLRGWGKLSPPRSRLPVPWEVTCLLVEYAMKSNHVMIGLHILLMFTLYLRPSEALRIRQMDLVAPLKRARAGYQRWTVTLHPLEAARPSKTMEFDETLQFDLDYHQGIGEAVKRQAQLRGRQPGDVIFNHENKNVVAFLAEAAEKLDLRNLGPVHPYRFRHGGASHDFNMGFRDLKAVQARGRFSVDLAISAVL
ncbi:unnamed protein product [Effrenium voratum]|uniref:Uncharacterized protein n=1 Tax=Effrenium voratum TaxID=2562239 RepID=A0AA36JPS6_9DINO|nr:unnamed protein product [Effrenium voratum]